MVLCANAVGTRAGIGRRNSAAAWIGASVLALAACLTPAATAAGTGPGMAPEDVRATVLPKRHEFARVLMGVKATITLYSADPDRAEAAAAAAFDRLAELDMVMSDYQSQSELMRLCARAGAGPIPVSPDLLDVLSKAQEVAAATGGLFDVRVGPLVGLWREARRSGSLPTPEALAQAMEATHGEMVIDPTARTVTLARRGMKLDLGGIGKGFAAAAARDVLVEAGLRSCMVSLSGDVAVGDAPPGETGWRIEVDTGCGHAGTMELSPGMSASTAGDVEQSVEVGGERFSHIIDPRTGLGSHRRGGATVVGRDGALVDGIDDALYLAGPAESADMLRAFPQLAAMVEERGELGPARRVVTGAFPAVTEASSGWFDPQNAPPAGFEALFNGKDLTNWQGLIDGPPMVAGLTPEQRTEAQNRANEDMARHWRVENGVIVFDGHGNSLQTVKNYRDFELFVDWQIEKDGDSGIYLRGSPQVQIWDNPIGSGGLYNNQSHPSKPLAVADRPLGQWNRFHIIMRGEHVTVYLNDVLVVDDVVMENYWERGRPIYGVGPIELQNHGNTLRFKNIFVRELPPLPESAEPDGYRMSWWRESRFGMFIHWGLYSVAAGEWKGKPTPGIGEWIMHDLQIPGSEYETLAPQFNPVKFDADRWVKMAADAGVRYIVITTKHHDGFSLFDSGVSKYDIMDATPFKRDIMKELSQACAKHGVRMCWYHSIWDWHHADAQSAGSYAKYVDVLRAQVTELLTKYGPIGAMWFDGEWDKNWTNDMGKELYALCRKLQPWTIVNNRVGKGRQGMAGHTASGDFPGDFGTPEQEIPATGLAGQDWESCMTMNDTWGFKTSDTNWKSPQTLVRMLIETTSKGGNFLLNVGPTPEGLIPQASVERMGEMGRWMKANSRSIYGCGAGPFKRLPWGRCTAREGTLYLHVFDWPADGVLHVPGLLNAVRSASLLAGGQKLACERDENGWRISLPKMEADPYSTVIALEIDGFPAVVDGPILAGADGVVELRASDAVLVGNSIKLEGGGAEANVGFWMDENARVEWSVAGQKAGRYRVELNYACEEPSAGSTFDVRIGSSLLSGTVVNTGGWKNYTTVTLGEVELTGGTRAAVVVQATSKPGLGVMNLRNLRLLPTK